MIQINNFLVSLQGCNSMQKLKKIHAQIFVSGCHSDPSIIKKLLNFCAVSVSGNLSYARVLFGQIENPSISAWNSIVRGSSQSPFPLEAILFYNRMIQDGHCCPDKYTFSFLLEACTTAKVDRKCREAHGSIIRHGYLFSVSVYTNLVRSYGGSGSVETAKKLFDEMLEKDLVAWNSMISCYSQAGLHTEAMELYDQMRTSSVEPDEFTVVSLVSCCAHLGALSFGVEMHKFAEENGFTVNVFVGNALIDMYAKCGSLERACQVFSRMKRKDLSTWNSIIVGLGVHGCGDEAIWFFRQMLGEGVGPNSITFIGLLSGCSHQGLVTEGVKYFHRMRSEFCFNPGIKHLGCMVDLFGRAGKFEDALQFIENSDASDDPVLWRILLNACRIYKNVAMGEVAMGNLIRANCQNAGDCVLMSGIYADTGDRQGVSRMRKMIKYQGIKTTPGWSRIDIASVVHKFIVDDKSHKDIKEIHSMLKDVIQKARLAGYVEEKSLAIGVQPTEECSEEWMGNSNHSHSEKLAIAFGLARTPPGTTLRIVKNLRVCRDCHSLTKFISKAFDGEIVVRDRIRFHHFKDGMCSCRDFL
ncbi:pentatricopeptide repeat-containing protein At3g56550-like [Aristolochia californica]|uniref:pentatricopeptide repeat-containing protein At3g56550-like n=1 Tax=Aristolochia californica TaxID=171875 RepID=UPI0035DA2FC5